MDDEELLEIQMVADDYHDVLDKIAKKLFKKGYVKESYIEAVKEREENYPTGLLVKDDYGIAIPHADEENVNKTGVAISTLKKPVLFKQMGGNDDELIPVNLVLMLAIKDPKQHMEIISKIMMLFSDKEILDKVQTCNDKKELKSLLNL